VRFAMFSQSRSMKPFLVAWVAYLAMMLGMVALKVFTETDFRCFYAAGVLARTDTSHLYDLATQCELQIGLFGREGGWTMFIQPPYEALLLVPFSLLTYKTAYLLMLIFNVTLIVPCFLLAQDAFSHVLDPWQPRPGLMFFVFFPLIIALMEGQASVRLLLLCCAAWHELRRGREFNAGLFLALALFKLNVAIPLALLFIVWRGSRALAGFVTGTGMVAALSFWFVGARGMKEFARLLVAASLVKGNSEYAQATTGEFPTNMPNLRGLIYGCGGRYLPHSWLLGVTLTVSAVVLLWVAYLVRSEQDEATAFALAIIGALFLSYHIHAGDLTLLLLPMGLLAGRARPHFPALVSACFILPLLIVPFGIYVHYLMAIPVLGLILLVARGRVGAELNTASHLKPGTSDAVNLLRL